MRLSRNLLVSCIIGLTQAASETAKVFIFPNPDFISSTNTPILTPEVARLIFAQRIGVTQYHSLSQVSNDALEHISAFGGRQAPLFSNNADEAERSQLLLVIDSVTSELSQQLQKEWSKESPEFEITNPPSKDSNTKLVQDLRAQNPFVLKQKSCSISEDINPFNNACWAGRTKILQLDANSALDEAIVMITSDILQHVQRGAMDVMMVLMPVSSRKSSETYGTYDMPPRSHRARDAPEEAPIELSETSPLHSSNKGGPVQGFKSPSLASCHSSIESCQAATNDCSGHGECYAKINSTEPDESCYTCMCKVSVISVNGTDGKPVDRSTYWGGPACSKQDISGPFWLLAGLSVVLIGLVSAGIGMLFSIGEEKLPSVIGAGVSGPKAR